MRVWVSSEIRRISYQRTHTVLCADKEEVTFLYVGEAKGVVQPESPSPCCVYAQHGRCWVVQEQLELLAPMNFRQDIFFCSLSRFGVAKAYDFTVFFSHPSE